MKLLQILRVGVSEVWLCVIVYVCVYALRR